MLQMLGFLVGDDAGRRLHGAGEAARTKASMLSVLARRPMALAKSLAWRGFTTATGILEAAMAVAAGRS
jgi:hypothetical protein